MLATEYGSRQQFPVIRHRIHGLIASKCPTALDNFKRETHHENVSVKCLQNFASNVYLFHGNCKNVPNSPTSTDREEMHPDGDMNHWNDFGLRESIVEVACNIRSKGIYST